ncbi:MAG: class II glutamine amidotransferase [Micrococcus sp.]|nr:class II glutamine amidotransferase [Micrococcus sp.]
MCRLFALHADQPVTARFWLLDAPYSLRAQSRFNADGTGVGWFGSDGDPSVAKRPIAAYDSEDFESIATSLTSRTMLAHVRLSSGTCAAEENTQPFLHDGIVFAHNGVLHVTEEMRERVRSLGAAHHVGGETDSEWLSALIAGETAAHEGDLHDGLVAALGWVGRHVPVYSLNLLVARDDVLYAVRYPEKNELWINDRPPGDGSDEPLHEASNTLRAHSEDLRRVHAVVIASEPMDDDPDWRLLDVGEMVTVTRDGRVRREMPFPPLAHPLEIEDLGLSAAASQAHAAQTRSISERRRRQGTAA